jgi:hypothetical protein
MASIAPPLRQNAVLLMVSRGGAMLAIVLRAINNGSAAYALVESPLACSSASPLS